MKALPVCLRGCCRARHPASKLGKRSCPERFLRPFPTGISASMFFFARAATKRGMLTHG
ncbi:hypothetical protein GTCCBUS3UF5_37490 [Geobacillus thermoleovorans CCB_US3_UF5]|uniref:Uncharacterized protein n=1 Tax=Geobacillus thermoleovorans CCB_US3_UF5 TaxID=1111068 RepID=A0ABM5MMR9_GEOTH|nr:hypothetical protein GTCCBUS3UF5_37490 [Geobacillus thermoleovorans CCB_US3_UF5]GAJ57204.1 hypothetical protein B23_0393 [Geobacillus thermoleovorans B23]